MILVTYSNISRENSGPVTISFEPSIQMADMAPASLLASSKVNLIFDFYLDRRGFPMNASDFSPTVLSFVISQKPIFSKDHPLLPIRIFVNDALQALSREFDEIYSDLNVRPSL